MNKWMTSIIEAASVDAVSKARKDISEIGDAVSYKRVYIFRYEDPSESLEALHSRIDGITAALRAGDLLVYQYPCYNGDRFESEFIHRMKIRGIKVALMVHDTEMLRGNPGDVEKRIFDEADVLITHGETMNTALREAGVATPMIIKPLFDFLVDQSHLQHNTDLQKKIIIAGNLRKSIFLEEWELETPLIAYGRKGELNLSEKVQYKGEFQPDDLLREIEKDGFGLAWDSKIPFGGDYQNYTRFNAPHKVSLYLSLGMPIIVWDQSAAAKIVKKYNLGFAVASLDKIDELMDRLTAEDLQKLKTNVRHFSEILREGLFTKNALNETENLMLFGRVETNEYE